MNVLAIHSSYVCDDHGLLTVAALMACRVPAHRATRGGSAEVARGINSIQVIKEAGGWRVTGIMVQAESVTALLPKEYPP